MQNRREEIWHGNESFLLFRQNKTSQLRSAAEKSVTRGRVKEQGKRRGVGVFWKKRGGANTRSQDPKTSSKKKIQMSHL